MGTLEHEVALPGTCFGIQRWHGDADHPSWEDESVYEEKSWVPHPLRFATEREAEAWVAWHCDRQYAEDKQRWEAAEAAYRPRRELYETRRQALIDAGLWVEDESPSPLVIPAFSYGAQRPVRRDDEYRVVPDAEMDEPPRHGHPASIVDPPCPVCDEAGGALAWSAGHFSCHGCWTRKEDNRPFRHADGCPKACLLPDCAAHARAERGLVAGKAVS